MLNVNSISFSSNGNAGRPRGYRVVRSRDVPSELVALFPPLAELFRVPPVIINAYPAPMPCTGGLFVDTYLRLPSFRAGLQLAADQRATAVILGQPLAVTQLLIKTFRDVVESPPRVLLILGGYQCPASLERYLRVSFSSLVQVVHVYGTTEIGAAVLAGVRSTHSASILYRVVDPLCGVVVDGGRLKLSGGAESSIAVDNVPADAVWTGDYATRDTDSAALRIEPGPSRLDPRVYELLESWTDLDWERRTGGIGRSERAWRIQLREGCLPATTEEVDYFEFSRKFGFSWLDKPDWTRLRWT